VKRRIAWSLSAVAYLIVPLLAWWAIAADEVAQARAHGVWRCGSVMVSTLLFASAVDAVLALAAAALAARWWTAARRWSWFAVAEVVFHAAPVGAALCFWLPIFCVC
jgi:hypothetical protein